MRQQNGIIRGLGLLGALSLALLGALAGEADIKIPDLAQAQFGGTSGLTMLYAGLVVCVVGAVFGLIQYQQTKNLPVHDRMRSVSNIIWETCKTYLLQQGKFLAILWVLVALCMSYYFVALQH